jgi:glucokinase
MSAEGATLHLGLDLGATNIKWAVVEYRGAAWETVDRGQSPTLAHEGADAVVGRMAGLAAAAATTHAGLRSVGIGVPGLYDPATGCTRLLTNMPGGWNEQPVAGPIAAATGLPVRLINDARAFGLAELRLGAGRGATTMIGLTLGTGVGGVVAVGGVVHQGHDGTAGELGHQTIDPDGPYCTCGNRGCLEAYARADQVAAACGTETAEEAARAAAAGDPRALRGIAEVGRYLGIGIANMVVALTPDRVVLGGGVSAAGDLLLEPIRDELRRRVFVTGLDGVGITTAALGTWAGAIGAAVHGAETPA